MSTKRDVSGAKNGADRTKNRVSAKRECSGERAKSGAHCPLKPNIYSP